jgi:hypothetical protein
VVLVFQVFWRSVMHFLAVYVAVVGGFTAAMQVARGVVRGASKLIEGEPRAALTEVAGGLAAPLRSAFHQVCKLGEDVCHAASGLTDEEDAGTPAARTQFPLPSWGRPTAPATVDGVAG